jgi:hypothetical protein
VELEKKSIHGRGVLNTYRWNRNQNSSLPSRNLCIRWLSMIYLEVQKQKLTRIPSFESHFSIA